MKGVIPLDKLDQLKELADLTIEGLEMSDESSMKGLSLIMAKNYFVKRINHQRGCNQPKNAIVLSYHRISHEMTNHNIDPILRNWIWYNIRDIVRNKPATQSTIQEIVDKISLILNDKKVIPFCLEEIEEFC